MLRGETQAVMIENAECHNQATFWHFNRSSAFLSCISTTMGTFDDMILITSKFSNDQS